MARPIVIWPDKVLDNPTQPVTDFGPALQSLLDDMLASVKEAEGIGIAANQIGVPLRVALVGKEDGSFFEIVNPQLLETTEAVTLDEGCLSVPGEWHPCPRFHRAKVKYQDKTAAWHEVEVEGRLAHVFQHEIGHLEGEVYVQRLSPLKRQFIRKAMKKLK
jgi:peptide deformylase